MSRIAAASDVFHAVADPTRRAILDRLRSGSAPVHELAAGFEMTRPAISKHLRVLRDASLVREEKVGRERHYRLTPTPLREVSKWVDGYAAFWAVNLGSLKRHLEGKK